MHEVIIRFATDDPSAAADIVARVRSQMGKAKRADAGTARARTSYYRHEQDGKLVDMGYLDESGTEKRGKYVAASKSKKGGGK